MAVEKWTLIDQTTNTNSQDFELPAGGSPGAAREASVVKRTLRGGRSDGVETIRVHNGTFAFDVLPTRGMGLWKASLGEMEIGWTSPVRGPVHPRCVPLSEPSGLGWLDGFDELLVRCGLESNGAPEFDSSGALLFPLHGRIANQPAHHVELQVDGDRGEITLIGVVEETRFLFRRLRLTTTITTRVGQRGLTIRDEIENASAVAAEAQILYHVNFGPPLLEAGSQLVAPVKTVAPRDPRAAEGVGRWDAYGAPQAGFAEQVYFLELLGDEEGAAAVLLKNAAGDRGVSLHFNKNELPCFTLWKNTGDPADGYVTGLEPGTNFPNPRSFEGRRGRVLQLAPGGKFACTLRLTAHDNAAQVEEAAQEIAALQGPNASWVLEAPKKDWSAE